MKAAYSNLGKFNCIAVERGQQTLELFNDFQPPLTMFFSADRQSQGGFAAGTTPNSRTAKQAPTQSLQLHFFQQSQLPLQQHAQIIGPNRKLAGSLRRPKLFAAQTFNSELAAKLFNAIFALTPPVISAPDRQRSPAAGQVGYQRLKTVARHRQQFFSRRFGAFAQ